MRWRIACISIEGSRSGEPIREVTWTVGKPLVNSNLGSTECVEGLSEILREASSCELLPPTRRARREASSRELLPPTRRARREAYKERLSQARPGEIRLNKPLGSLAKGALTGQNGVFDVRLGQDLGVSECDFHG